MKILFKFSKSKKIGVGMRLIFHLPNIDFKLFRKQKVFIQQFKFAQK